jgi:hypothetical protein
MNRVTIALALMLAAAPNAMSQQTGPASEQGRFAFKDVADGLLRLDTRSGAVALCGKRTVGWACQAVPEDRAAFDNEIGRLEAENTALKRELIARGLPLPDGIKSPPGSSGDPGLKLPSDADLDRAMSFLEKAWRRLVDMVQNFQREMDKRGKQPDKGEPDKKG